jgi:hypothetical protein
MTYAKRQTMHRRYIRKERKGKVREITSSYEELRAIEAVNQISRASMVRRLEKNQVGQSST